MVQALGAKLLDEQGNAIGAGGGELEKLARIDISGLDKRLAACRIEVACDVTNPLTGETAQRPCLAHRRGNGGDDYAPRWRADTVCPDNRPRPRC